MEQLVSEMTDTRLLTRMSSIEEYMESLRDKMNVTTTAYKRTFLLNKWKLALNRYADAINEAAYRNLLTIH